MMLTENERAHVRDWMKDWLTKAIEKMGVLATNRAFTNEDMADMADNLRSYVGSDNYAQAEDWDRLLIDVAGEHFPDLRMELQRATYDVGPSDPD